MKIKWLWIVLAISMTAHASTSSLVSPSPTLTPLPKQGKAAYLAARVLTQSHYKPTPLDDAMSGRIFDHYVKLLDPERLFFLQADIDRLQAVRPVLDDAIIQEDLKAPFSVFNLYLQRAAERFSYARSLLKKGFDFRQKESYQYGREKQPWAKSESEVRDLWRKRVKNDWLRLKLAGKDEKDIVATLGKRYDNSLKRINKLTNDDAFSIFMNAYTEAVEPHTNYMAPRAAEEFDISMRLSLVGIGAVLAEKDDYTTIRELVPGGPAALSGKLKSGDRILGVAQGEKGPMIDVQGWRLDDTVQLIRGALDSTVVLDVLPAEAGPDGKHQLIALVRKKVRLEEQSAKKSILTAPDGNGSRRIGVITLPTFYVDDAARQNGDPNYKSATRDVAALLEELKKDKVDAVLVDLRNDGGGSLSEAIGLTGLFIGKGPVVQTRDARGSVEVGANSTGSAVWRGPMAVLINRGSASASEIFAAAIQDYGRGLVIGEPSFGKGTVQAMIDLDRVSKSDKPKYGELKLTIAQFFRINGGTTQLRGVTPDISFPSAVDSDDFGESSYENALPWSQINPADYSPSADLKPLRPLLLARHESRRRGDKEFLCLLDTISDIQQQNRKKLISLNEAERLKERNLREAKQKTCNPESDPPKTANQSAIGEKPSPADKPSLRDDGLMPDERNLANDLAVEKERKNAKDILLKEAVQILADELGMLQPEGVAAANAASDARLVSEPNKASNVSPATMQ
jgi:carboxyl-terminal processing protease